MGRGVRRRGRTHAELHRLIFRDPTLISRDPTLVSRDPTLMPRRSLVPKHDFAPVDPAETPIVPRHAAEIAEKLASRGVVGVDTYYSCEPGMTGRRHDRQEE
jgi:hypothetical protein